MTEKNVPTIRYTCSCGRKNSIQSRDDEVIHFCFCGNKNVLAGRHVLRTQTPREAFGATLWSAMQQQSGRYRGYGDALRRGLV